LISIVVGLFFQQEVLNENTMLLLDEKAKKVEKNRVNEIEKKKRNKNKYF
jgi:hypothetical protein